MNNEEILALQVRLTVHHDRPATILEREASEALAELMRGRDRWKVACKNESNNCSRHQAKTLEMQEEIDKLKAALKASQVHCIDRQKTIGLCADRELELMGALTQVRVLAESVHGTFYDIVDVVKKVIKK